MKVIIDPRSKYLYGTFYLYGLKQIVGSKNIVYSLNPFRDLNDFGDIRFIIKDGDKQTKYFIHMNDSYHILESDYEWCDVYGCVNANFTHCPKEKYPKLVSLVPSFGIRYESTFFAAMINTIMILFPVWRTVLKKKEWNKATQSMECNPMLNIKHFFTRRYRAWKNRLPLSAYDNTIQSEDDYIFFLSTLWYSDKWNQNDKTVNLRRAHYVRVCKSIPSVTFEGGLLGDTFSSNQLFADVYTDKRETFANYLEKTKRSAFVFNTPAFLNCHGWKLGEFLALGKCIISTPLSNDLPYPLEHGVNIHFVEENEQSIREAIEYILAHPDYRHKLERGARDYWEKWGTPVVSLRLVGIQ